MKYTFFDHTADVLFEAYGETLEDLFTNAALALQEIQADLKTIKQRKNHSFKVSAEKIDLLLFDFLQELVFVKDAEELLFSKFNITINENTKIKTVTAECVGDKINYETQKLNVDAKAITLHQFWVKKIKGIWTAHVIVDI
jgi:SHS2 domain-containing protein